MLEIREPLAWQDPETDDCSRFGLTAHISVQALFMARVRRNDAQINLRLPSELKQTIEDAAAVLGQTVSEFAISTVLRESRQVLQDAQITRLSNRGRDDFLKALDSIDTNPNVALQAAARRYTKRLA